MSPSWLLLKDCYRVSMLMPAATRVGMKRMHVATLLFPTLSVCKVTEQMWVDIKAN